MTFLYPAGLWALLGVPVLILVYMYKPKYEERAVSSTYLWKLSEQFRKKHLPVQRFKKILLFLLQLLMIILGSLLIAQPQLILKGTGMDYIAILDASGSMQIAGKDGITHFSNAQNAILEHAKGMYSGCSMTVLAASEETNHLVERSESFNEVTYAVKHAECGWGSGDIKSALSASQEILWAHPHAQVYLYTDKDYAQAENITVVNVTSNDEWNVAITSLTHETLAYGTTFENTLISYGEDTSLTMALYVDEMLKTAQIVKCPNGEPVSVSWTVPGLYEFNNAKVVVEAKDDLTTDNEFWLFNQPTKSVNVLLVSKKPFYVSNALNAFPAIGLDTIGSPEDAVLSGYDIYVFDNCMPQDLPKDGAVWFINPPSPPDGTDIVFGNKIKGSYLSTVKEISDETYEMLTQDLKGKDISVLQFREVISSGRYIPTLLCGKMPVMLAGRSETGARQLLLLFDLHESNLPMLSEYIFLINNMLEYSMPRMLETLEYDCDTTLTATVLPFCEDMYLQDPEKNIKSIPSDSVHTIFTVGQPGFYTLLQKCSNESAKYCDFFVHMPFAEGNTELITDLTPLVLTLDTGDSGNLSIMQDSDKGLFNPLPYLAAMLLLILIIECVVVNREQF